MIVHSREKCPAKNSECKTRRVCLYQCSHTQLPQNFENYHVNQRQLNYSSDSCVHYNVANKLYLKINYQSSHISLVSSFATAIVLVTCHISFKLGTEDCKNFKLGVIKDLCANVFLGIEF